MSLPRTVVVAAWLAASVAFGDWMLLVPAASQEASAQLKSSPRDAFFDRLLVGGAEHGKIYVEIPLKAAFFADAKTADDRRGVWDTFFRRVLREQPPEFGGRNPVPYWGEFAYRKADWSSIADAVELLIGTVLRVRTPTSEGSAKVVR